MDTKPSNHPRQASIALVDVTKGLLIATLIVCGVGVVALGTLLLSAWAAPAPAMAAPIQPEAISPPASPSATPPDPTSLPPAAKPDDYAPSEPAEDTQAEPTDVAQPAPAPLGEYTFVAGDTLAAIASAHRLTIADLLAVNDLADPDRLLVGQTLSIPGSGPATGPVTSATTEGSHGATPFPEDHSIDPHAEDRLIDVHLSDQLPTAYEGSTAVYTTLVSTGLPQTPTPIGQYRVWIKLRFDDMAGPGYCIKDVPFVMYFHEGYGLHGVTWHGNFGHPMSHGCVNLPTTAAEWLFEWAEVGTLVNIHA